MSRISFGVWAAMALILAPLAGAQSYTVTDLGVLAGGFGSAATAINDAGQVAGFSEVNHFDDHAFVWTGGTSSFAYGINNSGQIVGESYRSDGSFGAFLWTKAGGMQDLGTLGGISAGAFGINNAGQVVGMSYIEVGSSTGHAFLWTASAGMQDLGALDGGSSLATAINDNGEVVGLGGGGNSFLWTQIAGMQQISPPASESSEALAINRSGTIVGYGEQPSSLRSVGFVRSPAGKFMSLGSIGNAANEPFGVNASLQVVGHAEPTTGPFGFLWTKTEGLQNLNDLVSGQYGIIGADAINKSGQIAATGADALLLTPIQ
jgi:probable HAF family extracellular repeat protein